ncbi:MAG TPA: hypothetical protein PKA39_06295, partial [Ignavibacteria bacterium]|nr:hypothetical protein [Ignavibacteria bacterium]
PIWNIADASVSAGFLIILFFHNRIFKTDEPQPVTTDGGLVSPPVDGEYPVNPDAVVLSENSIQNEQEQKIEVNDTLLENSQIEDTTENAGTGPGGPNENKD